MCAHLLKEKHSHGWFYRTSEKFFTWIVDVYGWTLTGVLRHAFSTLLVLLGTIALNAYLFVRVPKGFFPEQDNGRVQGALQADQDRPFQAHQRHSAEDDWHSKSRTPAWRMRWALPPAPTPPRMFIR